MNFPLQKRSKDVRHKLRNPEQQSDGIANFQDSEVEGPDSKRARLGEAPAAHLQIVNQLRGQQKILGHVGRFPQSAPTEINESSAIHKSMHTVMEQMNEIVDEAKMVVGAMNRISKSKDVNVDSSGAMNRMTKFKDGHKDSQGATNRMTKSKDVNVDSTGTSHFTSIASGSQMKGRESKVKSTTRINGPKLDLETVGGQRRKHGSEFGTIDNLLQNTTRRQYKPVVRRLIFDPEDNEPMDYNDE